MYKETIVYSISIGLNRGGILIFMPFIVKYLGVADYGEYNYVQILMQLIFPFLCFNIPSSISYTGAYHIEKGLYLLKRFIPYVVLVTFLLSTLTGIVNHRGQTINFLFWGILLGGIEALHNMFLAYLRTINKHYRYGLFTILKAFIFILVILTLKNFSNFNLNLLLASQAGLNIVLFLSFCAPYLTRPAQSVNIKQAVIFSLSLLPHIIALWIMNASSRFIVKQFNDAVTLGIFSIAYSIAMVAMILNSGIGIALPQNIIQQYDKWKSKRMVARFFLIYSSFLSVLLLFIFFVIWGDQRIFHILNLGSANIFINVGLIYIGFYYLGFYYYYSNILFKLKRTKDMSLVTLYASLFSILLYLIGQEAAGVTGVSIAVLCAYLCYTFLMARKAIHYEPDLKKTLSVNIFIALIFTLFMLFMTLLFYFLYE